MGDDRGVARGREGELGEGAAALGQGKARVGVAQALRVLLARHDGHAQPVGGREQDGGAGDDVVGAQNGRCEPGLDVDDEQNAILGIEQHAGLRFACVVGTTTVRIRSFSARFRSSGRAAATAFVDNCGAATTCTHVTKRVIGNFSLIPTELELPGFADLGLDESVLKAIADAGYSKPTPIQAGAIPVILAGRDVIGIAQTGTGKTASFVLPMLHVLSNGRARARMPRSLILSPTRELATQTAQNFETYGKYLNLTMALLIGGVGMGDQEKALEKGVDVLIATPGRLLDWFDRGKVLLGGVNIVVLDEADRMLDMGFMPDVERILSLLTGRRQTLLFSATMPPGVRRIIERFLNDPARIEVSRPATTVDAVDAVLVPVPGGELKRRALVRLIAQQDVSKAIVFANRKRDVSSLNRFLQSIGPERPRHPRRPRAAASPGDARRVQGRRGRLPGRHRRCRARPRHLRHAGRDQFRRARTTPKATSTGSAAPAAPARAVAPSPWRPPRKASRWPRSRG